jgi:hypothetical protein
MRYRTAPLLAGLLLAASASASAEFPAGKMYETVRVGEGIYAFVSTESKTAVVSRRARVAGGKGQLR